jgi:glycine cleavage system regulatory protein
MQTSLVLTVIGDDKPGLVEQLSDRIFAAGGNWEESRMARLAGKFAGLLRVSVNAEDADALTTALTTSIPGGLKIVVERSGAGDESTYRALRLELLGNDHPGIVRDISRVLAHHDINIMELETDLTTAPMTGEALFIAHAYLRIPSNLSVERLREVLEALAGELMVDIALEQPEPAVAS